MIEFQVQIPDSERVVKSIAKARKKSRIIIGRKMLYWGDQVINGIKRDKRVFRYRIPRLRSQRRRGALKASLWKSKRPEMTADGLKVELGWGVPYGYVMEHGPARKRVWKIVPTGFRSAGRSGGSTGIQFLRFRGSDRKIHYAKEVTRRWKQSELRPHFKPHTEGRVKLMTRDIARTLAAELG